MANKETVAVQLETLFMFQNKTGGVSKNHLSTRQLCKILCPPDNTSTTPRLLTAETNVLQQLPDGKSYFPSWRAASTVPVLMEACQLWYCYSTEKGTVSPALSCRDLVHEYAKEKSSSSHNGNVKYASLLTQSEWKALEDLPNLKVVFEALGENEHGIKTSEENTPVSDTVQDELKAFLSVAADQEESTATSNTDDKQEAYQSDGGTRYVKDPMSKKWIHESLAGLYSTDDKANVDSQPSRQSSTPATSTTTNLRKRKKPKFSAKKGRCWIYITGIPLDANEKEVAERFSKAGLLDLHPETQQPKIKLYRDPNNSLKGDASLCYAREESVPLAITLLDGAPFRLDDNSDTTQPMTVQAAKFEQHGEKFDDKRSMISNAKRKVAKLVTKQALDWDQGFSNGRLTGGMKGLRIIILKNMFEAFKNEQDENDSLQTLETRLISKCKQWGTVEKVTVFSTSPDGVVVLKFKEPGAASDAVKSFDGSDWDGRRVEASFWDGVTDFTTRNTEKERLEEEERHEAFGTWLENQELPEELQLNVE